MSRDKDYFSTTFRTAAASAATATAYFPLSFSGPIGAAGNGAKTPAVFLFKGAGWMYESAEANTDNAVRFVLDYTTDGSAFTTIFDSGSTNTLGLLDSGAIIITRENFTSPGVAGVAAATTMTETRVPNLATLRCRTITSGTSTIPAIQLQVYGVLV